LNQPNKHCPTDDTQGFEAIKQLLGQTQAYKVILGARDTARTQKAYDDVVYDRTKHSLAIFPLELSDLKTVKSFAEQTLGKLGQDKIDYLLLNGGATQGKEEPGQRQAKWCETYVVNHLCTFCFLPRSLMCRANSASACSPSLPHSSAQGQASGLQVTRRRSVVWRNPSGSARYTQPRESKSHKMCN
jgi:hypothetical protein